MRAQATGRVAEWHDRYGRLAEKRADKTTGLDELAVDPVRTCANGEPVRPMQTEVKATQPLPYATAPASPRVANPSATRGGGIGVDIGIGFAPDHR